LQQIPDLLRHPVANLDDCRIDRVLKRVTIGAAVAFYYDTI
jgi:hypothetical protein